MNLIYMIMLLQVMGVNSKSKFFLTKDLKTIVEVEDGVTVKVS
jgi:hypothetical protein